MTTLLNLFDWIIVVAGVSAWITLGVAMLYVLAKRVRIRMEHRSDPIFFFLAVSWFHVIPIVGMPIPAGKDSSGVSACITTVVAKQYVLAKRVVIRMERRPNPIYALFSFSLGVV